jgi:hypothetical protein
MKASRLKLDIALAAEKGRVTDELSAGAQWQSSRTVKNPEDPSAPMLIPMVQDNSPEELWPWFSGKMEDLTWFRWAGEDHARPFHPGMPENALIERMHEYCVPRTTGRIIEGARNLMEVLWLLETHFDMQTAPWTGLCPNS